METFNEPLDRLVAVAGYVVQISNTRLVEIFESIENVFTVFIDILLALRRLYQLSNNLPRENRNGIRDDIQRIALKAADLMLKTFKFVFSSTPSQTQLSHEYTEMSRQFEQVVTTQTQNIREKVAEVQAGIDAAAVRADAPVADKKYMHFA